MEKNSILKLTTIFEENAYNEKGVEFWFARDMMFLLGYTKWENFSNVIQKAKNACENSKFNILDHFTDVRKMVELGSDATREIEDIMLTRYACYLIAQNGDSRKEEVAFAQSYFAIQTRRQELIEERIKIKERFEAREKLSKSETELSKLIYERGVDDIGFARIRSKGYEVLFGGNNTKQMKVKLKIPKNRPLADFLPTVTIAAKNFATEITNFNVKEKELEGEGNITKEHMKNNMQIRRVLKQNNILPENLSAEEDIKKLEKKTKNHELELEKNSRRKLK